MIATLTCLASLHLDTEWAPLQNKGWHTKKSASLSHQIFLQKNVLKLTTAIVDPSQEDDDDSEDGEVREKGDHPNHSAANIKIEKAFHIWKFMMLKIMKMFV